MSPLPSTSPAAGESRGLAVLTLPTSGRSPRQFGWQRGNLSSHGVVKGFLLFNRETREKLKKKERIHNAGHQICLQQPGGCQAEYQEQVPGGKTAPGGSGHRPVSAEPEGQAGVRVPAGQPEQAVQADRHPDGTGQEGSQQAG